MTKGLITWKVNIGLIAISLLIGCRMRLYQSDTSRIFSFTMFDRTSIESVEFDAAKSDTETRKRIVVTGGSSGPETEAIKAATEGAVRGAIGQ